MRIVSLVPSLTETLCDLGFKDQIVGTTKFCIEPMDLHRTAAIVGGTKDFNGAQILDLKPTHVFCNREENIKGPVEELMKHVPVLVTFPQAPSDVPDMLRRMGEFLSIPDPFNKAAQDLQDAMQTQIKFPPSRFLYFIWKEPYMVAGSDTYISNFLEDWGWTNAMTKERYPAVSIEDIRAAKVDNILFSSEPYPFRIRDAERLRSEMDDCPPIFKIDGQMISWFGTRTLAAWKMMEKIRREGLPPL